MNESVTSTETGTLTRRQLMLVFGGVMTGMSLGALDATVVNTALTTIVGELGGIRSYAWVGTAYFLTSTAVTPLFGKLSDLYGRRLLFQIAIVTFLVGSALCGLSQSMGQLVLSRAVQGIGGGGLMVMAFIIIGDAVPPRERGRYVGAITSVFAVASVAGPLLGGFFVESLSWRWIFYINIPVGILALLVTGRALRLPFVRQDKKIDYVGATLMVAAVSSLVLALTWASDRYGWTASTTLGLLGAAVALAGAFIAWEQRVPEPIMPPRLFGNALFSVVIPMIFLTGAVLFGVNAFLPLFLQGVTGVSPTASGLLLMPLMLGLTASSIVTGRLTVRTGRYRAWPIAGTASTLAGLAFLTTLDDTTPRLLAGLLGMLLMGIGVGATMPTATLAVQNAVEWQDLGIASSSLHFFRSLGGVIGLAAFGAALNTTISGRIDEQLLRAPRQIGQLPAPQREQALRVLSDGITTIFRFALPLAAAAFLLAWFIEERPLRDTSPMERGQQHHADEGPIDVAVAIDDAVLS